MGPRAIYWNLDKTRGFQTTDIIGLHFVYTQTASSVLPESTGEERIGIRRLSTH
jgi:hypothetical protein